MSGYAARGSIVYNGEVLVKESGFNKAGNASSHNAKMRVIKGLANKLRSRIEGVESWTPWVDLSGSEQLAWLTRVAETIHWDEVV